MGRMDDKENLPSSNDLFVWYKFTSGVHRIAKNLGRNFKNLGPCGRHEAIFTQTTDIHSAVQKF